MELPLTCYCKYCINLVNGWCDQVIDSPDPNMERDCMHYVEKQFAVKTNLFDIEEIHPNCTVQILKNSVTGEVSVGWWPNESEAEREGKDAPD